MYDRKGYLSNERLHAFVQQIQEVLRLGSCESILEVGIGAKFVSSYFKRIFKDKTILEVDIKKDLNPDIVATVTALPFKNEQFDSVFCCQVLEHIPFSYFEVAINELTRVSKKQVILSFPDSRRSIFFQLKMPKINFEKVISFPFINKQVKNKSIDPHCWEIGRDGIHTGLIKKIILKNKRIKKIRNYRLLERRYQHFFILELF